MEINASRSAAALIATPNVPSNRRAQMNPCKAPRSRASALAGRLGIDVKLALKTLYEPPRILTRGVPVLWNLEESFLENFLDVRWDKIARNFEMTKQRVEDGERGIRNADPSGSLRRKYVH